MCGKIGPTGEIARAGGNYYLPIASVGVCPDAFQFRPSWRYRIDDKTFAVAVSKGGVLVTADDGTLRAITDAE